MDTLQSELMLADEFAAQSVQAMKQSDGEGRTGTHAAPGGQVAIVADIYPQSYVQISQSLADSRMLDLIDRLTAFDCRIDHVDPMIEERRQISARQIAILVDRPAKHDTAVLPIPGRVVGTAAEEGNSIRS